MKIASEYRAFPLADLIQEANLGLMEGIEHFDYRKGYRLSTYASIWMRAHITRAIADKGYFIAVPPRVHNEIGWLMRYFAANGGSPDSYECSAEEISRCTGLSRDKIANAAEASRLLKPVWLENGIEFESNSSEIKNVIPETSSPCPESELSGKELSDIIFDALCSIESKKEKLVLLCRNWGSMSLDEIGSGILGVTRERVRQIEERAKGSFRKRLLERLNAKDIIHYFEGDMCNLPSDKAVELCEGLKEHFRKLRD